jgi:hypothetical protein
MMTATAEEATVTAAAEEAMMTAAAEEAMMTAAAMALAVGKQKTSGQQLCVRVKRNIRERSACNLHFLLEFDTIVVLIDPPSQVPIIVQQYKIYIL